MQRQRPLDDCTLMGNTRRIQAGARPSQFVRRATQQGAGQRRRSSGIADAHFAANEQLAALLLRPQHSVAPSLHGELAGFGTHGRFSGEIAGARPQRKMAHPRQRQRSHRSQINHLQRRVELLGKHTDRGAAVDEVAKHLSSDRLRKCRDTFLGDTVVSGKNGDENTLNRGSLAPLQSRQLGDHCVDTSQRTRRFSQLSIALLCRPACHFVRYPAGLQPPLRVQSATPLRVIGKPATVKITR